MTTIILVFTTATREHRFLFSRSLGIKLIFIITARLQCMASVSAQQNSSFTQIIILHIIPLAMVVMRVLRKLSGSIQEVPSLLILQEPYLAFKPHIISNKAILTQEP